ncbi:hypothetical protein Pgy4_10210, partial [Pseudomonas savastanoi pv. glycinea str. race 4]
LMSTRSIGTIVVNISKLVTSIVPTLHIGTTVG